MATCIVQLDNFQGQYYPGDTIIGKVICSFSKTINSRGIRVTLEGKEHTEWKQTSSQYDRDLKKNVSKLVRVSGNSNFLERELTLAREGDFHPGRHEYPFSMVLPKYLPATYVGTHGWIKYFIKAAVVIPFGFDHKDSKEFKVTALINFNEVPGLQLEPMTHTTEKDVRWLFRSYGFITLQTHVEKAAFTLGEMAKIKFEVTNMSTKNIERVEVQIGMEITCCGTSPTQETKTEYEKLAAASDTGVGAHGERIYMFDLTVPSSAVLPNFNACKLFKLTSKIEVIIVMGGFLSNIIVPIAIELGHIPARTQDRNIHQLDSPLSYASYSPEGGPSNTPLSPALPRVRPPPYSEIDPSETSFPPHHPVSPHHIPESKIYPTLPQSSVLPTSPPEVSTSPSAPAKEELWSDDDFVLV